MNKYDNMYLTILLLPPSRGQELKLRQQAWRDEQTVLPPSRGQELKPEQGVAGGGVRGVAPFTGAGIETDNLYDLLERGL